MVSNSMKKLKTHDLLLIAILVALSITVIYPFVMIVIISFRENADFMNNPLRLPQKWVFENYTAVFEKADIVGGLRNSLIITFVSVCLQILLGSLTAYALSKMNFKKSKLFSALFLAPMVFPIYTVIIPLYMMFKQMHLLNNYGGLIIVYAASGLPLVIFILTSFMKTIPFQISESAFVEGASHLRVYFKIILPLIKPAIATTFIISGLSIWNDFFLPLLMISNDKLATLPLKVFLFAGQYTTYWTNISAVIVILVIPILTIYLFLQSQIISGVVAGSVKG